MEYILKRKIEEIDQDINEHITKNTLIDIQIEEIDLTIVKLQAKVKRLRLKKEVNEEIIDRKTEIINKAQYLRGNQ